MAHQSPLISIPKKTTDDVDWSNPIRTVIARSYGEDPNTYAEECSVLQRCRQDAVRGAGSDQTARDLLYKYFGQLELLELRFSEIKVSFPWNDAFTLKSTTQTSLAFEKASIIYLLASVLSSLAAGSSRADPEGVKRAYYNSRAAAGMLTYINENFLHAPSTDLSREVVHLLNGIMMAQATEVFTEKLVDEKKAPALCARSANTAAGMYAALVEEMKEFQGKGIFDRNWLYVLQIKAKLFASLAQYHRSAADSASGKSGAALVRMKMADTLAQEAQRQANGFTYTFAVGQTPSLPSDAATNLLEICKAHATLCVEAKEQATKDNDLIYHDILPSEAALPQIEKLPAAAPITIQEVYANPDVSKLIGPDIFGRLVPMAVHESASLYSEEKVKLVRGEVEKVDLSEGETRASMLHLGLPGVVSGWRRILDGDGDGDDADVELSSGLQRLASDVQNGGSTDAALQDLASDRERCERELRELSALLDNESRECERMRAKYAPSFTQSPSGPQTSHLRSNIASNLSSLEAAATSDRSIVSLWNSIQADAAVLAAGPDGLQRIARDVAVGKQVQAPQGVSLLDLQDDEGDAKSGGLEPQEKEELSKAISEAQDKLDRLSKIRRERDEVLKDLKEKIQSDDVSNLLLLNRRSQNVEPQLFASELEKFRPYQGRINAAIQAAATTLQELEGIIRNVEKGKGVNERSRTQKDRQKRVREWERKLEASGEAYREVRTGLSKGQTYYDSLNGIISELRRAVKDFVSGREAERNRMVGDIETRQRLAGSSVSSPAPPPPPQSGASSSIESRLANLSLGNRGYGGGASSAYRASPPPPPQQPASAYGSSSSPYPPPPPSQPAQGAYASRAEPSRPHNPYDFGSLGGLPSAFSTISPPPPAPTTSPYAAKPAYQPPTSPQYNQPSNASPYASPYASPPPQQSSGSAYFPPPPSRPAAASPAYPSQPTYPAPQSQHYAPPAQQQGSGYQPPYPGPPPSQPARSASGSYYPPPPPSHQSSYSSLPPQQPQHAAPHHYQPPAPAGQQYPSPPPQQHYGGYGAPPPPPPQQGQQQPYGGYQPPPQGGGYQYR